MLKKERESNTWYFKALWIKASGIQYQYVSESGVRDAKTSLLYVAFVGTGDILYEGLQWSCG